MPLSWNEIRTRATAFAKEWENASDEHADAKSFWDQLFQVYGVPRRRVATFESRVTKHDGSKGYIDLLWKKVVLVEHKSRGKDLKRAHNQAKDYFPGLKDADLPRYIVVCDFERFRITDLDTDEVTEFKLKDLPANIQALGFIAGYEAKTFREQDPVNIDAAEKLGALHDALLEIGYEGHELEVYLVRLLFCLFADDTGIFVPRDIFQDYILQRTQEDGSDLGPRLQELFETLNRPTEKRFKNLDEALQQFPYVNGKLFAEAIPVAPFTSRTRAALLDCCDMDWGQISPAIFGSLFQSIKDIEARRNGGEHYTSEKNILKAIKPLFLDELVTEFETIKTQASKLRAFHDKLASLQFFDPACGCGNFLVIAYRELRLLELDVILRLHRKEAQQLSLDAVQQYVKVDVDQFHGIEIEEWPAQIARVAMWLMDHQMNIKVSQAFGNAMVRIPLVKSANIVNADALTLDWNEVVPREKCNFILGNPPFRGAKLMTDAQKASAAVALHDVHNSKTLDLVSGWYVKAARFLTPTARAVLVSTNSITQGEQVGLLWGWMLQQGLHINFAHRTFKWQNEARGQAAVHCVIIGFSHQAATVKRLYDYETVSSEPHEVITNNISPYLVDASNMVLQSRTKPICPVPEIGIGNKPIDNGHYLFTDDEKEAFLQKEPAAAPYFRKWLGADEFINGWHRWVLWLGDCTPAQLKAMPHALKRIEAVRKSRAASDSKPTQKLADTPTRFHVENFPKGNYLIIPSASSERRPYIPIGFMTPDVVASNLVLVMADAGLYEFGVMTSLMHMAWTRQVCGRLKSDYRYSAGIVYNNFPWPTEASDKQRQAIEAAAQTVLDVRAQHADQTLGDLYDPRSMPADLLKAHQALDRAVDAAYSKRKFASDAERVAYLLEKNREITESLLATAKPKKSRAKQPA